jgi:hypothetical protein
MRTIQTAVISSQPPKRQIDFPDGREFRSTGPHVRNPGACGSRRTADVTHSRCVGHELSFHPWMSARRIGGGRMLTPPSSTSEAYGLYQVQQHRRTCSRRSFAAAVARESPDRKYRRRNTGRFRRAPQPGSILVSRRVRLAAGAAVRISTSRSAVSQLSGRRMPRRALGDAWAQSKKYA